MVVVTVFKQLKGSTDILQENENKLNEIREPIQDTKKMERRITKQKQAEMMLGMKKTSINPFFKKPHQHNKSCKEQSIGTLRQGRGTVSCIEVKNKLLKT